MRILFLFILFGSPVFASAQIITTVAGIGSSGISGDGGQATAAKVESPNYLTFDRFGNLYFSEATADRIRKIDASGIITTVAGPGTFGLPGDGGAAVFAWLHCPAGVACDSFGNLYIADRCNSRIRRVNKLAGTIATIAGTGFHGDSGDGGQAILARFSPYDLHFDKNGNLFFSDFDANKIRKIDKSGVISTVGGSGGPCSFDGDGGPATNAHLCGPSHFSLDDTGNIYIADFGNKRIRKIDTSGIITTIAGTGLPAPYMGEGVSALAANVSPSGVAFYKNRLVLTDDHSRIRLINEAGIISTIGGTDIPGYNGDNIPATSAKIYAPRGGITDTCGNVYFADATARIRKISFPCGALEVARITPGNKYDLYPSPASAYLMITAEDKINSVSIINLFGQVVVDLQNMNTESVKVNIAPLPSGVYVVRINGYYQQKIIKE